MNNNRWGRLVVVTLGLAILWFQASSFTLAQGRPERLFITGSDVSSLPSIELHVYGVGENGNALDLTQESFLIQHNNVLAGPVQQYGTYSAGTFTLFLIDIPTGVSGQFSSIQDAIIQYASSPTMMEQVDSVAVYKVGERSATELLPADTFYNGVRNLFSSPLVAETGATALVDSMMGLLEELENLKPEPEMVASMVVITDGTDVVSTRYQPEDVAELAADLNIPIYTIWLDNVDLSAPGQEVGQDYLKELADSTGGLNSSLNSEDGLRAIWDRISSFRDQIRLQYVVDGLTGGTFPIEVSLSRAPEVKAETNVSIAGNNPIIVIDLPPESRKLSVPNLDEPLKLHFSTTTSWLDGVERQLSAAQFVVNGTSPQSIPVEDVSEFDIEVSNLVYGDNSVQIVVLDEQGLRASSPLLLLTVEEGRKSLPDELEPTNSFGRIIGRVFLAFGVLVVLAGVGFLIWRQGWLKLIPNLIPRGSSRRSRYEPGPPVVNYESDYDSSRDAATPYQPVIGYLEVLESVSRVSAQIALSGTQVRIGRSPAQSDITFENDITVSRLHATLLLEGNHYRLFDAQSTSGVWVNEQEVPEYGIQLIDGDEIHLGAVHLRYRQA